MFRLDNKRLLAAHGAVCNVLLTLTVCLSVGCASANWTRLRSVPHSPLNQTLGLLSRSGPKPTSDTLRFLRRHALEEHLDGDPEGLLDEVQQITERNPIAENVYIVAEVAYIAAKKMEARGNHSLALDMYGTSVSNAYMYLLDPSFHHQRNAYDPRFRLACDLYNSALENGLRAIQRQGLLKPGQRHQVKAARQEFDIEIQLRGPWYNEDIRELRFVSDYEVEGLVNRYYSYGLGVPLIAVYEPEADRDQAAKYYPSGMSVPVTAFLRVANGQPEKMSGGELKRQCVLEIYDSLATDDLEINGRLVPLETDLTTPLAYSLDNPAFKKVNQAWKGLVNPSKVTQTRGLYMLEPFDPDKVPVLMVHGFASSPITWMEMFNDLRGSPDIRNFYQFWFYLYPTGEPFWMSAADLREELAHARMTLDRYQRATALDQMVLVGHSMGGLVSKLQTVESRDEYWKLVSSESFDRLQAPKPVQERLRRGLFFRPNRSIRRVVTIATPHKGSNFSNGATQWLGRRLISLPRELQINRLALRATNTLLLREDRLLSIDNSVDALATDSPILEVMRRSPRARWVRYHNIIAKLDERGVLGKVTGDGDGVVSLESARCEDSETETIVAADHMNVHRMPTAILEVYNVLQEHMRETRYALGQTDHLAQRIYRLPPTVDTITPDS